MGNTIQLILMAGGMMAAMVLGYAALSGPSASKESGRRLQSVRFRHSDSAVDKVEAQYRKTVAARKPRAGKIAGSGSRMEALELRLHRTGKGWTMSQYLYVSGGLTLAVLLLVFVKTGAPLLSLVAGLFVGIGLPHFIVGRAIGKRVENFTTRLPDALDLLVRGLRSGLPVTETLGVVASELPGPVGEEFKLVTDRIKVGRTMEEALQDTADRLNMPEFNFFCITLAIQRETGGNLAETLSNLSDVLRKRAQMKLKVKAMSSESKASAYIVGSLPFIVFALIYTINPAYLSKFFVDERLIIAGLGGLTWLGIGSFIMAKMVNFEI
ncbi:pilus assembly protein TadB [Novosphingobium sp. THN1]|uniref:type II secretion system F family protein n=1 Tax=unclassified Novosphingobium TaxID=2644732 RepID=UPI000E4A9B97|nr:MULTISPECIES: type II secretion system F family protein [unclassified Novosphingobium]AXU17915.1 pilus assembly protein TadB [Novosphingobium sp. THN1]MBA4086350.1 pilus assembly protein TadB [Novosphingobium sp.]NLR37639.1 type II secretion system F family protein [Novosphingobium sp. ERW19]